MSATGKVCILLVGICLSVGIYAAILKAQRDQARASAFLWESSANSQATALKDLQAAREKIETALKAREDDLNTLSRTRAVERRRFKNAQRADKAVEDWSRVRLPDAVLGLLRAECPRGRSDS